MRPVVRGNYLRRVVTRDNGFPDFTSILCYVYEDGYYDYWLHKSGGNIVVGNEVSLFRINKIANQDKSGSAEYFLFTKTLAKNVSRIVSAGQALSLSYQEAKEVHRYLCRAGMICVFPHIRKNQDPGLYKDLCDKLIMAEKNNQPEDIIRRVFGPNYRTAWEQKVQIETTLGLIKENISILQRMDSGQSSIIPIFEEDARDLKRSREFASKEKEYKRPRF